MYDTGRCCLKSKVCRGNHDGTDFRSVNGGDMWIRFGDGPDMYPGPTVSYSKVSDTKCGADGSGTDAKWDITWQTTGFDDATCAQWCTDAGDDCVAYSRGTRSDLTGGCLLSAKNGVDLSSSFPLTGSAHHHLGIGTATTQNVVSVTWDSNWNCFKKNIVPGVLPVTAANATPGASKAAMSDVEADQVIDDLLDKALTV